MKNRPQNRQRKQRSLNYSQLEPRHLLAADFSLASGVLTLDDFSLPNSDFFNPGSLEITQVGTDYQFSISEGGWNGTAGNGLSLNAAGDVLTVDNNLVSLNEIFIDSTAPDILLINFGDFSFGGDLTVVALATDNFGSQFTEVIQQPGTQLTLSGTLDVSNVETVNLPNLGNDFNIVSAVNADDVILQDNNSIQLGDFGVSTGNFFGEQLSVSTSNDGDITQLPGSSIFTTVDAEFNADGSGVVSLLNDNDFFSVSATGSTVEILDIDSINIDSIIAQDNIRVEAGFGDGDINGNGSLGATEVERSGGINFGELITTGANGQVLLQADSFISNSGSGDITTSELLIQTNLEPTSIANTGFPGTIALGRGHQVDRLAVFSEFSDSDGIGSSPFEFEFYNNVDLEVANLTYQSILTSDVNVVGLDVEGDIRITVFGDLTQTADAPIVVTGGFGESEDGSMPVFADNISLTSLDNDFNEISVATQSGFVQIVDRDDITVGDVDAGSQGTLRVRAGASGAGAVSVDGDVFSGSGVWFQAASGVNQAFDSFLSTDLLVVGGNSAIESGGDFVLTGTNSVNLFSANVEGDLQLSNSGDLRLTNSFFETSGLFPFEADLAGVDLAIFDGVLVGGDLDISTGGDITQNLFGPIVVSGLANFDAAASGIVSLQSNNDFQDLVSATGSTVEIFDINDLDVSSITAVDDILLESGFGDGDTNGDGVIGPFEVSRTGGIFIGDLTTTDANGQILLQTDHFINDFTSGIVTTSELLVQTNLEPTSRALNGGFIQLVDDNQVDRLAVSSEIQVTNNGATSFEFQFSNSRDLEIANLTYQSVVTSQSVATSEFNIAGLDVEGDARFRLDGDLTQATDAPVSIAGGFGTAAFASSADNIRLTNPTNSFNSVSINGFTPGAVTPVDVEIVDQNDITIESIVASGQVSVFAGASGIGGINVLGDIDSSAVTLQAASLITQSGGDITVVSDVILESTEGLSLEDISVSNGDITIDSAGFLVAGNLDAINLTVSTEDDIRVDSIDIRGAALVNSAGVLNVPTVTAFSAALTSSQNLTVLDVNTVGDATLTAGNGNLNGDRVDSSSGAVNLSSLQRVNVGQVIAFNDVTVQSLDLSNLNLVTSTTGSVSIEANGVLSATVVEAAVDATLTATFSDLFSDSVTAGNSAELSSGAFLFTRNVEAPDVRMIAGTNQVAQRVVADTAEITAQIDLGLNDIQVGQLTIEAGDDIFDAGFLDGNRVTTDSLVIRAGNSNDEGTFGGVVLETDVNNLSVVVEGDNFGNIIIFELDDIVLGDIDAGDGRISVQAGGTITGGNIRTRVQSDQNDVRLTALGDASDIRVDQIDVGNLGDVVLLADDDVVIAGEGNQVRADVLFVNAKNRSAEGTDGIALATDVVTAQLIVGDASDANQNRGDITISNASSLDLDFARTLFGSINATANGNLEAQAVISEGVDQADAIHLIAQGSGADVVTGLVLSRNRLGGVVITAGDDVRDSNLQDDLPTIADSLLIFAGNNNPDDAFNGINSTSIVNTISATALGEGTIFLANTGQLTVNTVGLDSGNISVINRSGFLAINDLSLSGTSNDDRVFISTEDDFDIGIGRINAGAGVVTIDSADDIFDTDLLDDLFIEAGLLVATSRNGSIDAFDGIVLDADVENFLLDAQGNGVEFLSQRA